jgi:hypothetical protein
MAKQKAVKAVKPVKHEIHEEFEDFGDFFDMDYDDMPEEGLMTDMMAVISDAQQHSMEVALALTEMIVEKSTAKKLEDYEKEVLRVFEKTLKTVSAHSPVNEIWKKVNG